jgi:hypothetical protein
LIWWNHRHDSKIFFNISFHTGNNTYIRIAPST